MSSQTIQLYDINIQSKGCKGGCIFNLKNIKPALKENERNRMTKIKTVVKASDIEKIVQQIVERFHPQKVILFGSYAEGIPTEDSDVDLLVVMETDENPLHTAAQIAAAVDHPFPLDIIVSIPSKLEDALKRKGVFATEVMTKGVVLYEA